VSLATRWRAAGLDRLPEPVLGNIEAYQPSVDLVRVTASWSIHTPELTLASHEVFGDEPLTSRIDVEARYSVHGSGVVVSDFTVDVPRELPALPRVGVHFTVPKALSQAEWYGRGPHECYCDRKTSAFVGRYQSSIQNMQVPYIVPMESGGRCDVRWLALSTPEKDQKASDDATGLLLSAAGAGQVMHINVSPHDKQELAECTHHWELDEDEDVFHVHADCRHMGVGGDDTSRPSVSDAHLVKPGRFNFTFRLMPLGQGDNPAHHFRGPLV